jgi:hypothetical protein
MKAEDVKKQVMGHYHELASDGTLNQKYPEMDMNDGKKHILYVQCLLERIGFYRTYLPYLMLNDSETHSAIIASIQKRDFNNSFEDYEVFLATELISWADYIVFPALLFDCRKMFSSILEVNPDLKFVMDMDDPHFQKQNETEKTKLIDEQLLNNLKLTHVISCSSAQLRDSINAQFEDKFKGQNKRFTCLPTFLVSSYMVRKSDDIVESNSSIKIGLLGGNFNQVTIDTIAKISVIEQKEISICIYGLDHSEFNYPETIKVEFFKSVKFLEYFTTVERMNLDFMILLGFNPNSEQDKAIFQYGELALLSIPILCDSQNQARRFIKPDVNGFVVTEKNTLEAQIQKLLKDRSIARKAGTAAQGMALKHLSWNPERASQLVNIYK